MNRGRFTIGAVIGTSIGIMGAVYALTNDRQRRRLMRRSKRVLNQSMDAMNDFIS